MNAIEKPRVAPSPEGPFRHGWRFVSPEDADGQAEPEQPPPALEGHRQPDGWDFAARLPSHVNDCLYLKMVFESKLAKAHDPLVLYNSQVDWNLPGVRPMVSDLAVFLGAPGGFDRPSLVLREEPAHPVLVVERVATDTRTDELNFKKDVYHRAGVPLFVIIDIWRGQNGRDGVLQGFRHAQHGYEPMRLDDQKKLWLEPLGVWLMTSDRWVLCIDGKTGERFGHYGEQVQSSAAAEARIMATAKARDQAAAARICELEAEVRRLRGLH